MVHPLYTRETSFSLQDNQDQVYYVEYDVYLRFK